MQQLPENSVLLKNNNNNNIDYNYSDKHVILPLFKTDEQQIRITFFLFE